MKKFSPAVFGIIIICFFLPFMDVACSGQKVISVSGFQMVTGTTLQQPGMFGAKTKTEKVDAEPLAIATFVCVIIGLLTSFIKNKKSAILPTIFSIAGIVTLLMLKNKLDNDVLKAGAGMVQISYVFGFWAILVLLIISAGLNGFIFSGKDDKS